MLCEKIHYSRICYYDSTRAGTDVFLAEGQRKQGEEFHARYRSAGEDGGSILPDGTDSFLPASEAQYQDRAG